MAAQQEDTYEAALRAADALFSGSRSSEQPKPAPVRTPAHPGGDTAPQPSVPAMGLAEAKPGGRVLRVIDEPPLPEIAKLEAERAPKRRGRKPGSKNKPKVALAAPPLASSEVSADVPRRVRRAPAAPVAAILAGPRTAPAPAVQPAVSMVATPSRAPSPPVTTETSRVEKYAWVRTKLKAGERWKRRLPKIAW